HRLLHALATSRVRRARSLPHRSLLPAPAPLPVRAPPPPHPYPLSLHDALPISSTSSTLEGTPAKDAAESNTSVMQSTIWGNLMRDRKEHTSELQSRFDLVCRLLLEKKKHHRTGGTPAGRCGAREIARPVGPSWR